MNEGLISAAVLAFAALWKANKSAARSAAPSGPSSSTGAGILPAAATAAGGCGCGCGGANSAVSTAAVSQQAIGTAAVVTVPPKPAEQQPSVTGQSGTDWSWAGAFTAG